jgi:hypothetical protein
MTQEVDQLVRAHLRELEQSVDAAALLRGIQRRRRLVLPDRAARWGLAAAAALLLGVLLMLPTGAAQASAQSLVRDAQRAHALAADRCYTVQLELDPALHANFPLLATQHETRLWTRGDRFWIESTNPNRQWAWGRDEQGRVWMVIEPTLGVRFEPAEVPAIVGLACDIRSVRMDTLLRTVLKDFDLVEEPPAAGAATRTIRAEPKRGRHDPFLASALLEIEPETKVIQRLVLHRRSAGAPLGTVTFTLTDTRTLPDALYHLEGQLGPCASILTRTNNPHGRLPLVLQQLGQMAREGK